MKRAFFMLIVGALSLLAAGQAIGATPGLISYWRLNECSGTTATDSIHANNGTLVNGPSWASGRVGCALSFDGADDHVAVAPSETLAITNQVTIEAAPVHFALEDLDLDGDLDMVLQFTTRETGIVCGTTSAKLTGTTIDGVALTGTDSVNTVGCK